MKKLSIVTLISIQVVAFVFNGCAAKIDHKVSGKVEPIQIKHEIILNTQLLYDAFFDECSQLFNTAQEIKDCADDKLNDFVAKFTSQV